MSVREYVGARYVPLFATPLEWSNTNSYEPLTIVQHEGNSYTSRQYVPAGIDIANEDYWALTGNYNAQIEQYRQEVKSVSDKVDTFDQRITDNFESIGTLETEVEGKADKAVKANQYSNTPVNNTFVQDVDGRLEIKTNAIQGFNAGAFPQQLTNPLPMLWITYGYRHATTIKYGNDYTATNLNATYDAWEPARNHPDIDGKFHIDCTTFVLLVMCGIRFNGSTYSPSGTNVGNSYPINFFSDTVKDYMNYEYQVLGIDPATEPEHRRLLASEMAKMLDDAGQLNHLLNGLSAAGLRGSVHPGDIVFFSNTDAESHYMGITHCAIVAYNDLSNTIIIDSAENRGGDNNTVNYHVLSDNEAMQIKCKITCPQYLTIFTDQQMIGPFSGQLTQNVEASQTYHIGGVACVKATEVGTTNFTFKLVFPEPVGEIVYTEALTQNQTQQIIVPPDVVVKITADKTAKYTHHLSNCYLNSEVID